MKKIILITFILSCYFSVFANEYSVIRLTDKYGIIDKDLTVIIEPQYEIISTNNNVFTCFSSNKKVDCYNSSAELIHSIKSPVKFTPFTDSESIVNKKYLLNIETGEVKSFDYYTFVNNNGFLEFYGFKEGLALTVKNTYSDARYRYSVCDTNGFVILDNIEQSGYSFSGGFLPVVLADGKSGFVDTKGNLVIETSFYINPDELLAPRQTPAITYYFNEGVALVQKTKELWYLFTESGESKQLPDNVFLAAFKFSKNLVAVYKKESEIKKYGFMNKNLGIEIPCVFDYAENFVGNYAIVKYQGKDGLIDAKGNFYASEDLMVGVKRSIKVK